MKKKENDHEKSHGKSNTSFIAPVMNGSGGDLVGIQASRMTTYLHKVIWIINTMNFTNIMTCKWRLCYNIDDFNQNNENQRDYK